MEEDSGMTYEQVESFLAAVTCGNISAAADYLYVTQSTVSSRIQALEKELGTPLLLRQKGQRTVELTSYGEAFVPIAGQWAALWKDTQNLKTLAGVHTLRIASVDAVNNYTLVPLFKSHMQQHPNIRLSINTFHSNEIHQLVQSRSMDIGYVFSRNHYPDIISRPVFRELVYLVCREDSPYQDGISPKDLDPEREVYLRWGPDFQLWHDSHWSSEIHPKVTINTGSMYRHYLDDPESWALAPMSVIRAIYKSHGLTWHTMTDGPAPRICYQLTNRYSKASCLESIEIFTKELEAFIAGSENICTYEEWMQER